MSLGLHGLTLGDVDDIMGKCSAPLQESSTKQVTKLVELVTHFVPCYTISVY